MTKWPILLPVLAAAALPTLATAQSQDAGSFAVKRCNEDAFELRLDPGPFQEAVGSDYAVVLEDGKARVVFVVQDCSEYWVDGEDLGPAQHTNLWVLIEGPQDVRPVIGAQVTRPTMTWFSLFHGSTSSRGRQLRLASGTAPEPIEGVSLDPPGPQRGGRVTAGPDLSYSWNMSSVAPPVRLVGFNHDIVMRNSEGKTVFKRIQALANVVAGLSEGTLTVVGGSDPKRLIGPGTYPITGVSVFPIWARINLGGPPPADAVERALLVEAAEPLEVPAGAQRLRIRGTTNNNQPIAATNPEFSAELCDRLRAAQPSLPLGEVRSQLTSNATLDGTHIGEGTMHAEACIFAGPPPTLVASLAITASDGDVLYLTIRASRTPESPPPPHSEARGGGTITRGTGRFAGASGEFNLSAKSHGDLLPGTNVATQRDIDINGYINLRAGNER